MIYGFLNGTVNKHPSKVIEFRSTKNLDVEALKKEIYWLPQDCQNICVNDQYAHWLTKFKKILDKHMPLRKMKVRKYDAQYMTPEWKEAIRKKRKYAKKFRKDNSMENWEQMKKWRNNATRLRRQAIKKYWKNKSEELKKNPGKFYKTFMPFIKSKSNQAEISLNITNIMEHDQLVVAEEFSKYFSSIADHIGGSTSEINSSVHPSVQLIRNNFTGASDIDFKPITMEEVEKTLNAINPHKAISHDRVSPKILKLLCHQLAPSLTELFNTAIKQSTWPTEWKKGVWVPVNKKEDSHCKENYRPVTILSALGKVFEKLLTTQLSESVNNILDCFQSAYRRS